MNLLRRHTLLSQALHLILPLLLSGLLIPQAIYAQADDALFQKGGALAPPNPPRLVNNLSGAANFLSPDEAAQLENKLETFSNATSNQIAIVVVDTLYDYGAADLATKIGHRWKIGQAKFDNGIVILIKPTPPTKVFIAIGYGLEGAIPDAVTEEIIQTEIIPEFKKGNYYQGLNKATDILIGLAKGEYNAKDYEQSTSGSKGAGLLIAIAILLVVFFISRGGRGGRGMTIGNAGMFFWGSSLFGGGGSGFGGGFGGGGGSFGGFGGGSFGGGGAGGSW